MKHINLTTIEATTSKVPSINPIAYIVIALSFAICSYTDIELGVAPDPYPEQHIVPVEKESPLDGPKSGKARKELIDILARVAACESIPNHIEDMKCLLTVVMNRADSKHYPNTVWSVVSNKTQFNGYGNSRYWSKPSDLNIQAATEVADGYRAFDKDVLYYFNPVTATDKKFTSWCRSQTMVKTTELKGTRFTHQYFKAK